MILKTLIVDDEQDCREALLNMSALLNLNLEVVGMAETAGKGLEMAKKLTPDLIFLDIEMPDNDGFWLLEQLPRQKTAVVFVTAYDNYAVKAFRFAAVDYLLKPIHPDNFRAIVDKCTLYLKSGLSTGQLMHRLNRSEESQQIAIPQSEGYIYVAPADVLWINAESNYSRIWLRDGKSYLVAKTLGKFEETLDGAIFLRIHKSYLVNMNNIHAWRFSPSLQVTLDGNQWLEVSTRKTVRFLDFLSPEQRSLKRSNAE